VENIDRRRVAIILAAVVVVFAGGTAGFMAILHESWHAALYRTIVTASLTGLDTTPRGPGAELLTVVLVLAGVTIFGYLAVQLVDSVTREILGGAWRERKQRKMIDQLRDHVIVCGYGRVGRRAAQELRLSGIPYVVLDFSEEALSVARERGDLYIDGNGTDDEDLARAGIDRARGVIVSSDDDADNLYITLSAKTRRSELNVVARASSDDAERKLRLAGADRVVTPYTTAGVVMAGLMIKPQVTAFLSALAGGDPALSFEEIAVAASCDAAGQTIGELEVRERTGATVVAVRKAEGSFHTSPSKDTLLESGDVLVGVGSPDEIRRLEELFQPRHTVAT
jgi:voltage-gated potassium channel